MDSGHRDADALAESNNAQSLCNSPYMHDECFTCFNHVGSFLANSKAEGLAIDANQYGGRAPRSSGGQRVASFFSTQTCVCLGVVMGVNVSCGLQYRNCCLNLDAHMPTYGPH